MTYDVLVPSSEPRRAPRLRIGNQFLLNDSAFLPKSMLLL